MQGWLDGIASTPMSNRRRRVGWNRWFGTRAIRIGPLVILALEENLLIAWLVANLKHCHSLLLKLHENGDLIRQTLLGVDDRRINERLTVLRIAYEACPIGKCKP